MPQSMMKAVDTLNQKKKKQNKKINKTNHARIYTHLVSNFEWVHRHPTTTTPRIIWGLCLREKKTQVPLDLSNPSLEGRPPPSPYFEIFPVSHTPAQDSSAILRSPVHAQSGAYLKMQSLGSHSGL